MWVIANVLRKHQLPVKAHAHPDRGKQTVSALSDPHTHRTCIRTARKGVSESATAVIAVIAVAGFPLATAAAVASIALSE